MLSEAVRGIIARGAFAAAVTVAGFTLSACACSDGNIPLKKFSEECAAHLKLTVHDTDKWSIYVEGIRENFNDTLYFVMLPRGFELRRVPGRVIYGAKPESSTQEYRESISYGGILVAEIINLRRFDDDPFTVREVSCISERQDIIKSIIEARASE
jgi:hypothetical protein